MVKTKTPFKIRALSILFEAACSVAVTHQAEAQSVRWSLPDLNLSEGKVGQIALVFDNCTPDSDFKLPKVDGLDDFGKPVGRQSSSQIVMNNLKVDRVERVIFSFLITPQRKGRIEIPAFEISTNKGKIKVAALNLDIDEGRATAQQSGNQLISSSLETSSATVWQGQIFPIRYELLLLVDEEAKIASDPNKWKPAELVLEDWPQSQPVRRNVGGYNREGRLYETKAYAPKPGNLEIPAIEMEAQVVTGRSMGFFGQSTTEQVSLKSNTLKLTVKELPKPAPASFTGAVGQYRLESKLSQTEITAGQPVTWTLVLKGTGNWPDNFKMPARQVPSNLRVIQPEAKKENVPNTIFEATLTEDVVLIPDRAGKIDLAPVQFTYFNPEKGAYETLSTEPTSLTVSPDLSVANPANTVLSPTSTLPDNANPARPKTEPDLSRPTLPRDPISGSATSFAPFKTLTVLGASAVLVLGLLPFWLVLARRHSVEADQVTRQRKAFAQALHCVQEIDQASDDATRKNLLLRWQHLVATGFAVEQATPSIRQLKTSPSIHLDETWIQLWRESDSALYSSQPALPSDWSSRARTASSKLLLPKVPLRKTFSPQHLFPRAAMLLLLSFASVQAATEDPRVAYEKGDFAAAQKGWQLQARQHPADWIAHNNLGLAFAQEKDWGAAVAQWASAFLRNPRHPDVEWNLALGLSHLDNSIPELDYLQKREILPLLACQLSPFQWQVLALFSTVMAVAAAAYILFQSYRPARKPGLRVRALSRTALVLGLFVFLISLVALRTYGVLSDSRAGMIVSPTELKSIPTDVDSKQATREITTGMVVIAEKSFLGWWKIRLANNETGWVRQDHLHRFYH